jgi:hypothetical protein
VTSSGCLGDGSHGRSSTVTGDVIHGAGVQQVVQVTRDGFFQVVWLTDRGVSG